VRYITPRNARSDTQTAWLLLGDVLIADADSNWNKRTTNEYLVAEERESAGPGHVM
jgi:hypothetical protein